MRPTGKDRIRRDTLSHIQPLSWRPSAYVKDEEEGVAYSGLLFRMIGAIMDQWNVNWRKKRLSMEMLLETAALEKGHMDLKSVLGMQTGWILFEELN